MYPDCPFPKVVTHLNKYSLLLYVYHPLFLSFTCCYVVAYTTSMPCLVETAMLYVSAIGGCMVMYFAVVVGGPRAKSYWDKQGNADRATVDEEDDPTVPLLRERA